jgi:hypothetical protein
LANVSFEKLEVYRVAEKLADEVWTMVVNWNAYLKSIGRGHEGTGEQ